MPDSKNVDVVKNKTQKKVKFDDKNGPESTVNSENSATDSMDGSESELWLSDDEYTKER